VVKLIVQDIDTKRNMIHIKAAKGRKDRYTVLSEAALRVLREYWKAYQPKNWLFPGSKQNSHLTTRTVEKILPACRQTGKMPAKKRVLLNMLLSTPCAIVLLLIFKKVVQIYGIFKSYLDIRARKLQKSILTLASGILDGLKALWILESNDKVKKMQFETSPRVVDK
jgi:hypothetical protein